MTIFFFISLTTILGTIVVTQSNWVVVGRYSVYSQIDMVSVFSATAVETWHGRKRERYNRGTRKKKKRSRFLGGKLFQARLRKKETILSEYISSKESGQRRVSTRYFLWKSIVFPFLSSYVCKIHIFYYTIRNSLSSELSGALVLLARYIHRQLADMFSYVLLKILEDNKSISGLRDSLAAWDDDDDE